MTIRFAILSAVSRKYQAASDKVSLNVQEEKGREFGLGKSWVETTGPYRIPGESRSFYVDLSVAEQNIPQIKQMLDDAKAKRFDVLIIYAYDRLGDLADMIAQTLRFYNVQMVSITQSVDILPPDEFDPYASDSEENMRILAKLTQRYRIATMRRRYSEGMEKRVNNGLYSIRIMYGYKKPAGSERDSKAIPIIVPEQAKIIIQMKDMFLSGSSPKQIARWLNENNIPTIEYSKMWYDPTVKKILLNPFYAGKVTFGRFKVHRDPRAIQSFKLVKNPSPQMNNGKHQAIYSWQDHLAILKEFERRSGLPNNVRYPWSGLLRCSVCGSRLQRQHNHWRCRYPGTDHIKLKFQEADKIIPIELQKSLSQSDPLYRKKQKEEDSSSSVASLKSQRQRIQRGYEKKLYTLEEAEEKMKGINEQLQQIELRQQNRQKSEVQQQKLQSLILETKQILHILPEWIHKEDPRTVNDLLLRLCSNIVISPKRKITIHFRE